MSERERQTDQAQEREDVQPEKPEQPSPSEKIFEESAGEGLIVLPTNPPPPPPEQEVEE